MFRNSFLLLAWLCSAGTWLPVDEVVAQALSQQFSESIAPLMDTHCGQCHSASEPEAELDLSGFRTLEDVNQVPKIWLMILDRVDAGEMPPDDAEHALDSAEQAQMVGWMRAWRQAEATRHAGDPGVVLARRLSNAEYDYSVRDLTGVDLRPTRSFPVDPANEAGFDNSGESLSMSPALMNKYIEAARATSEHLVFTPTGLRFAVHPVVTDTDRDKYCVKRIVEFYERQPTDLAAYFRTAWELRCLRQADSELGPASELDEATQLLALAERKGVSPQYLELVWSALNEPAEFGPLDRLQDMWQALPTDAAETDQAERECERMRDFVQVARQPLAPFFENLDVRGIHNGAQAFVLWKNQQYAAHRRTADFSYLDAPAELSSKDASGKEAKDGKDRFAGALDDPEMQSILHPPTPEDRPQFEVDCQRFCEVFPDAFYISERGRDYLGIPRAEQEKGRLLSAGFHSMMGYFRDDSPLVELILDDDRRRELDALWQELDFFAAVPQRQYQGFLWFERTDSGYLRDPKFDFARPEDQVALGEPSVHKLAELYEEKAVEAGATDVPRQAIRDYFANINRQMRWVEETRLAAETLHLEAMLELAERAAREPMRDFEKDGMRDFYRRLRNQDELTHEQAIQDLLVSVLISPQFAYRHDLLCDSQTLRALDDYELASRLSYFLWSSLPDAELLELAQSQALHDPQTLAEQTRRMLRDPKALGLATEFLANWLDFRRFEEHNSVDRERFPMFDEALRAAMYQEPIRFFADLLEQDRSLLDLIDSKRTFVNPALAAHYGIDGLQWENAADANAWQVVEDAGPYGRGGLLPMAVFLTKNAPGLRTSPVKRGYWVVRRLLGERIPPPPPNVPELPEDETQLGDLTLRETLALHRAHASCAGCHNRIDSIGLVFEGFGPVGERRTLDLGGRPVDTSAQFPDGSQRDGVEDLREYLRDRRQLDFIDSFNHKLLSYALGRSLQLSDEMLLEEMRSKLQSSEFQIGTAFETIVTSPQFLNKRGRESTSSDAVLAQ